MKAQNKITEVLLKARNCGYKCHDFARIRIEYKTVEKPVDDCFVNLLGPTIDVVEFTKFEIEKFEDFVNEFFNHKDAGNYTREQIAECVVSHFKQLVAQYLKTGDTLTAGAGLLGAHQMVYVEGTEAWLEHLRLEKWALENNKPSFGALPSKAV